MFLENCCGLDKAYVYPPELVSPNEKISLTYYIDSINTDCYHFQEALALSESSWNNIIINVMQEEYQCLNEGIAGKFLNSIKKFFNSMTDWIRGRYRDLRNFSNKTLIKMKKVFGLIAKFAEENEERILEGAKTREATANILDWYPSLIKLENLEKSLESLKFSDEFESIINDTRNFVEGHFKSNNVVTTKITPALAKIAINNAKKSVDIEGLISKYVKMAEDALKETEFAANEGNKAKHDEKKIIEAKNAVEEGKKKILTSSKKTSILINLANKAIIDSHRINVACASMYTGK